MRVPLDGDNIDDLYLMYCIERRAGIGEHFSGDGTQEVPKCDDDAKESNTSPSRTNRKPTTKN